MSKPTIRQPDRQPCEVIETLEETITRYFDPTTFDHASKSNTGTEETNLSENPEIISKYTQFQDLYERFKELRNIMSEIIEKFRKINTTVADTNNDSASINVVDTQSVLNFNDCTEPEISELEKGKELGITFLFPKKSIIKFSEDFNIDLDDNLELQQPETHSSSPKFEENCSSLLETSKKLLINLIDKEIESANEGKTKRVPMSVPDKCVRCKIGCIQNIGKELNILKNLECFEG